MKNLYLTIACCTLLAVTASACGGKTSQALPAETTAAAADTDSLAGGETTDSNGDNDEKLHEELTQRIDDIYTDIFAQYNKHSDSPEEINIDEGKYCSKMWMDEKKAVEREEKNHPGEEGCFGYDYWVQGQDWHDLSFSDIDVYGASSDMAEASLTVHNMGEDTVVDLTLVKENGKWMIDNLYAQDDPSATVRYMRRQYLKDK